MSLSEILLNKSFKVYIYLFIFHLLCLRVRGLLTGLFPVPIWITLIELGLTGLASSAFTH